MNQAVTIDNYDVKIHERYAVDRESHDPKLFQDASEIPRHSNLAISSSSIHSKWEELFEMSSLRHPFAVFVPPPGFTSMRNRFFSQALSPEFDWIDNADDDEDLDEKEREELEMYKRKILSKKSTRMPSSLVERDKTALLKLFDAIGLLNALLREIHGRRLQYQKG